MATSKKKTDKDADAVQIPSAKSIDSLYLVRGYRPYYIRNGRHQFFDKPGQKVEFPVFMQAAYFAHEAIADLGLENPQFGIETSYYFLTEAELEKSPLQVVPDPDKVNL